MLIAIAGKRQPDCERARSHYLSSVLLLLFAFAPKRGEKEWDGAGHKSRIKRSTGRRKNAPAIAAKMRETTTARQSEQKGSSKQRHKKQRTGGGEGRSGAEVAGRKNEMKFTFINHSCALQTERNEWEAGQVGDARKRERERKGDSGKEAAYK